MRIYDIKNGVTMCIALMGGTGFIGQCLLREYSDRQRFVAFTPKKDMGDLYQSETVEYVTIPGRTAEDAGGQNPYAETDVFNRCSAAVILGFARPEAGVVDTFERYLSSIAATASFLEACRLAGITNIVLVSSRSVYGKHTPLPHREDEAAVPFSFYGAGKLAAEAVASACSDLWGARVKTLRLAQVIGANERQGVVAASMRLAAAGRPLQLWGNGDETAREYLYVRDATSAIMCALDHPEVSGVFNIGTGQMTSTADLLECIAGLRGNEGAVIERHPENPVEAVSFCMDVSRARDVLGWQASWTLQDALCAINDDVEGAY